MAKNNRWFQAPRRWEEFHPYGGGLLLILIYMGLILKWWPAIEDSPLMQNLTSLEVAARPDIEPAADDAVLDDADARDANRIAPGAAGHLGPDRGVLASNTRLEKIAGNKNALWVVSYSLGNDVTTALITGVGVLSKCIDEEHARTLVASRTRWGSLDWRF